MQHVAHRRSDPHTCNKCFAPLPPDGICREPHATSSLPPMQEQPRVPRATFDNTPLGHPDHDARRNKILRQEPPIGRSHTGNMAKAVGE